MNDQYMRNGSFSGDFIFRGELYNNMYIPGYKEDFQLVSKDEEKYYLEKTLPLGKKRREPTKVPKFVELPPLLKEMLINEAVEKKIQFNKEEIKLPLVVKEDRVISHWVYE